MEFQQYTTSIQVHYQTTNTVCASLIIRMLVSHQWMFPVLTFKGNLIGFSKKIPETLHQGHQYGSNPSLNFEPFKNSHALSCCLTFATSDQTKTKRFLVEIHWQQKKYRALHTYNTFSVPQPYALNRIIFVEYTKLVSYGGQCEMCCIFSIIAKF